MGWRWRVRLPFGDEPDGVMSILMNRTTWLWSLLGAGLVFQAAGGAAEEGASATAAEKAKAAEAAPARPATPESRIRSAQLAVDMAIRLKRWDEAETKLKELEALLPNHQKDFADAVRFSILVGKEDMAAAYQFAARMSEVHSNNAPLLNDLAWRIATDNRIRQRDLALADKLATRANTVANRANVGVLDTLARVKFMRGNGKEAIALAERAVELCEPGQKKMLEEVVASYRRGELPRVE